MVQVLQFRRRLVRHPGWAQQELAEFYRVESALTQAGLSLETDQGVSDEGDPWFVFCRPESGEVVVHFARLGDEFIIDGFGYEQAARGSDFGALVRELISRDLFAVAKAKPKNGNVFLHPAALLIVLVGTAFLHSGQAKAGELHDKSEARRPHGLASLFGSGASAALPADVDPVQAATLVAGVILAFEQQMLVTPAAIQPGVEIAVGSATAWDGGSVVTAAEAVFAAPFLPAQEAAGSHGFATAAIPLAKTMNAASLAQGVQPAIDATTQNILSPESVHPIKLVLTDGLTTSVAPLVFDGFLLLGARPAALPTDDAGELLQGVITPDHLVLTLGGALPGLVLSLIESGLHVVPGSTPVGGGTQGSDGRSPPPASSASQQNSVDAIRPPALNAGAPQSGLPHQHDPVIDAAVAQFIGAAPHWEVLTSGRDVVLYDADILTPHNAATLDSVTFTLSDGSSVSLVGTAAELVFAHTLH